MACYLISASGAHGYPFEARVLGILKADKVLTLAPHHLWRPLGNFMARNIFLEKTLDGMLSSKSLGIQWVPA